MNIWIVTFTTIEKTKTKLEAIVVALTPNEARALVRDHYQATDPIECKQLGSASSSFRTAEVIMVC